MFKKIIYIFAFMPCFVLAGTPVTLSEETYQSKQGVVVMHVNWGRAWPCGKFENAQLQSLVFTEAPVGNSESALLVLDTPSKLFVDNKYLPYAYVIKPGKYHLTAFDVKAARSTTDVVHIKGNEQNLIKEGKPVGGSFMVNPGEVIYIGHIGLDCGAEPFLWRFYLDGREEFEKYVAEFKEEHPYLKDIPMTYRLFSTKLYGNAHFLENPTVQ